MRRAPSVVLALVLLGACGGGGGHAGVDAGVCPLDDDAGGLDAGTNVDVVDRFLATRDAQAEEACRCASDVPFCLSQTAPPPTTEQRTCLDSTFASDLPAFTKTTVCLEGAVSRYLACATPHACAEVSARQACKATYEAEGTACFACLSGPERLALVGCLGAVADAGM